MAYAERMPSGLYRAIYRGPDGKKRTAKGGPFTHKRKAENAAAAAEAQASKLGWRDPGAAGRTWKEWCEEWWPTRAVEPGTAKRDESPRDKYLMPRWGDVRLVDITRQDVKAWVAQLGRDGLAPATVEKRVHLLSSSLNAAIDAEVLTSNPAHKIVVVGSGETDRRRYLTREEADRLMLEMVGTAGEEVLPVLFGSGMRWGEMAGLQIPRVDLDRGTIRVSETWDSALGRLKAYPKGRKIRVVPVAEWALPHLESAMGNRRGGHVFTLAGGTPLHYKNWHSRVWTPATERAGLEGIVIHDTRHTYASWLLQKGVPLAEVGRLLGHVSPQTTQIYAHLAETPADHIRAALA